MKDYQVLIDHAWALDPDLFEMFREQFQIHLNKRRSSVEFQGKITEAGKRRYVSAGISGNRHHPPVFQLRFPENNPQCKMPSRDILPRKISWDKQPLHPSKTWVTPIESIHPPLYFIAGLSFETECAMIFVMEEIREVCAEFGWEMPDDYEVMAFSRRQLVRALMELEG